MSSPAKVQGALWPAIACILISFFSAIGLQASGIFLPIFADDIGASKFQIGIVGAGFGAAYLGSSLFFGRLSDMRGRLPFIRGGLGLATAAYFIEIWVKSPAALIGVRTMLGFCIAMSDAALMAYNFEKSGRTGRFVSLAALGWLCGGIVSIFYQDYKGLFILSFAACAAAFAISWTLAREEYRHSSRPAINRTFIKNYKIYVPFLLRNIGGNMFWFIMPLFLVSLGGTKSWVAIIQCVNTATQFVVMMFMDRLKASFLFVAGMATSGLVFIGYALARNCAQIIPSQVLLALSWSGIYIGALMLLFKQNEERATSVGVLLSAGSLSQAVGPFLGGIVAQYWGYPPLMYIATLFCFAGTGIAAMPSRQPERKPAAVTR